MVNWVANVFPGILGRTCDRPCEPACRRGRVEQAQTGKPEPVAICRLKRVAADFKDDVLPRMPTPVSANGRRVEYEWYEDDGRAAFDRAVLDFLDGQALGRA